ncbi:cell division protein SepF, partial [Actinoplanes sp. NPDC051633]
MSALRKAGVWLGLVEEDDERGYDDRGYRESGSYRDRDRDRDSGYRYADEFADEDDVEEPPAPLPRARTSERLRVGERNRAADLDDDERPERSERTERAERSTVRSLTRSHTSSDTSGSHGYATRDNLALAPQPQVHQRPAEEDQR